MLTIQFGQCGNQLGHELFSKISKDIESRNAGVSVNDNYDYSETTFDRWFTGVTKNEKRTARAILVDTERKVVDKICGKKYANVGWCYSSENKIYQASGGGSGKNWARGYYVKAKDLENGIVEAVRLEIEKTDRLDGFLGLLGCAGGTGSGVGSRILEVLRDEYPTKTILGTLILPFASGEVSTQNYNILLTLAKFTDVADAVILLENDQLLRVATSVGAGQRNNDEARSLRDLNEIACEKILAVFQPIKGLRNEANYFARTIAPHPGYKITTIKCTVPLKLSATITSTPTISKNFYETGSLRWLAHVRELKRTLRIFGSSSNHEVTSDGRVLARRNHSDNSHHAYRRSIANILITRGYSNNLSSRKLQSVDKDPISSETLSEDSLYSSWVPKDCRFTHLHQKRRLLEREKFLALITNNSQICEPIDALVDKARNFYAHAAFLHQYKEFGMEDDDFLRAFAKVENVIKVYGELDVKL